VTDVTALPANPTRGQWLAPAGAAVGAAATAAALLASDPRHGGNLWPRCPFHALTGLDCPGCGSLRALRSLLEGDVVAAAGFNVLVVVALPVLIAAWLRWAAGRPLAVRGVIVQWLPWLVGAWWVARNLPWHPFVALAAD
jgi:hypothetical protein